VRVDGALGRVARLHQERIELAAVVLVAEHLVTTRSLTGSGAGIGGIELAFWRREPVRS